MLKQLLQAIKTAIQQDLTLREYVDPQFVICAQSGIFPKDMPKPNIVISPDTEALQAATMSNDVKRTITVTIYGYTEAYGEEIGLIGDDGACKGVVDIGNDLEVLLDNNKLGGLVQSAEVLQKTFPIPPQQWYYGLNEVRVQVRYKVRQQRV